jgi:hypothetical protein
MCVMHVNPNSKALFEHAVTFQILYIPLPFRGCLGLLQLQIFFSWWSRSSLAPEICGAEAVGIQESSV